MPTIEVAELPGSAPSDYAGVAWRAAFERDGAQVGEVRIPPGTVGGWHHHGSRTLYGYVVSGKSALEFGPKAGQAAKLKAGDFFCVPAGLVHRDVNTGSVEAVIMVFNIGPGASSYDAPAP